MPLTTSGTRVLDPSPHIAQVEAWLSLAPKEPSHHALVERFQAALDALSARTLVTLGEVTVSAITHRVVHNGARNFPLFKALTVGPTGAIQCVELRAQISSAAVPPKSAELVAAMTKLLVEFLTVVGNLTAQILTPDLHAALSKSAHPANGAIGTEGQDKAL